MPGYRALSLLGLPLGVAHGWRAAPASHRRDGAARGLRRSAAALESVPGVDALPSDAKDSILDDGHGHVNSHLAQAIYEWEVSHQADREQARHDHKQFSARDGIRLVDELAGDILTSRGEGAGRDAGVSKADLVQEGMIALLDAMSTYDNYRAHASPATVATLEEHARDSIRAAFLHFLAHASRPLRLPLSLQTTAQAAEAAAAGLRRTLGREPTLGQVAGDMGVAPARLARHRELHRRLVSRAGTFASLDDAMEAYDPRRAGAGRGAAAPPGGVGEGAEEGRAPSPRAAFATRAPSASAARATADEQELMRLNAPRDDWTREAPARVRDTPARVVADTEESSNPLAHAHHARLNAELGDFLRATLTDEERTVIGLRFGLVESRHGGRGWTARQIGTRLGVPHEEVVRLASGALDKMRKAAPSNWDEDDNEAFVEVSL